MRRLTFSLLIFLLTANSLWAGSKPKPQKETIKFGGQERTFYVFVPEDLSTAAPLLLLLHGSGHNGMSLIDPWKELAAKEALILVAPDASNPAIWDQVLDSPDFLHAVIEMVKARYPVDGRRVYLFGHSAGAVYGLYVGVIQSQYFAAVAVHAGSLLESDYRVIDFAERKIPVAIWVGTKDPYFTLENVRATRDAFKARGISVQLTETPNHDHNYYAVSGDVNKSVWDFLKVQRLAADPVYKEYGK